MITRFGLVALLLIQAICVVASPLGSFEGYTPPSRAFHIATDTKSLVLAFSPNGRYLASGNLDGSISVWELGTEAKVVTLDGNNSGVIALTFSADGRALLSGDRTGLVTVRAVDGWKPVGSIAGMSTRRSGQDAAIAFAANRNIVAVSQNRLNAKRAENSISILDLGTLELLRSISLENTDTIGNLAFSVDGRTLYVAPSMDFIRSIDPDSGAFIRVFADSRNLTNAMAPLPSGSGLARFAWPGDLLISNDGSAVGSIRIRGVGKEQLCSLAISRSGTWILSADSSGRVRLWNLADGRMVASPAKFGSAVYGLAFTPDERYFATATDSAQVLLWDLASYTPVH